MFHASVRNSHPVQGPLPQQPESLSCTSHAAGQAKPWFSRVASIIGKSPERRAGVGRKRKCSLGVACALSALRAEEQ